MLADEFHDEQGEDDWAADEHLFFRAVGRLPLLSSGEETELSRRVERGDKAARDQMVLANLRLVVFAARRYQGHGVPLPDLIQEGAIGLEQAVSKFDWRRGYRFSTYAMWWIRQACQYAIYDQGRIIRLPAYLVQRRIQLERVRADLEAELRRSPSLTELLELTKFNAQQAQEALDAAEADSSLDRRIGESGEAIVELVHEAEQPELLAAVIQLDRQRSLQRIIGALPDRERQVVSHRYGLSGSREMTQRELSDELGISCDAVALIERKALERLRKIARCDPWLREEALAG